MNCKPGDLAVCIRHSDIVPISPLGRLCTVLYAVPLGDFTLPDGHKQISSKARDRLGTPEWVVEWQSEMAYPMVRGGQPDGFRYTRFGVVPDHALRPIRPDGITDDEVAELYDAPKVPEGAPA